MGSGKTLITLSALNELDLKNPVLIIAPLTIARATWIQEMKKWDFDFPWTSLIINEKGKKRSKKDRIECYKSIDPNIFHLYFLNQDLVVDLIDYFGDDFPFKTIIIDESQGFKSHRAKRFLALKKIRPNIHRLIELTGTPAPKGLMDLWSQIYLLDGGTRLGPNITAYRNTFFTVGATMQGIPIRWDPKPMAKETIYKIIDDIVISIENTNLALPGCTFKNHYVYLDEKEKKQYKTLMKNSVLNLPENERITAANAGVLSMKLSQMASGALYIDDERNYTIIHKQKIEQLRYLVENLDGPILISYYFKSDLDMILNDLSDYPLTVFDKTPKMIDDWNAKKIPILLIQPLSAGHGLNLQHGGHHLIWYSLPWSLEAYLQTNARLYRQGQKDPVTIHHIMTKGTIDERILYDKHNKKNRQDQLLSAVKRNTDNFIDLYYEDFENEINQSYNFYTSYYDPYVFIYRDKTTPYLKIDTKTKDIQSTNAFKALNASTQKGLQKTAKTFLKQI